MKFLTKHYFPVFCMSRRHLLWFFRQRRLYQCQTDVHLYKWKDVEVFPPHLSLVLMWVNFTSWQESSSQKKFGCSWLLCLLPLSCRFSPGDISASPRRTFCGKSCRDPNSTLTKILNVFSHLTAFKEQNLYITNSNSLVSCLVNPSVCSHGLRRGTNR